MNYLHEAQLANIVTSYCTCLAGILPLAFTCLTRPQPGRWLFAYLCILITGIPTVWFHAQELNRLASSVDVGTNILLAWALQLAVTGDFMGKSTRRVFMGISTGINMLVIGWIFFRLTLPSNVAFVRFGGHGAFHLSEAALIVDSFVVLGLFVYYRKRIPGDAKGLIVLVFFMFFAGLVLASASNSRVAPRILPWHAAWHVVGAFGFITLWLFNHVRFNEIGSGAGH